MSTTTTQKFELVGIGAVVISLIFVGYELRQANEIALVDSVSGVYDKFTHINEILMTNPEVAELLVRGSSASNLSEFTPVEQQRISSWIRILFNTWLSANIAYDKGKLAEETYHSLFDDITSELEGTGPGVRVLWRDIVNQYPSLAELAIVKFIHSELDRLDETS